MRGSLRTYVLRRLALIFISMFIVITASFMLVELIPGDPAVSIAGAFPTEERVAEIRGELRLDQPLHERYFQYVAALAQGDLGSSFFTGQPVVDDISRYLPNTLEMVVLALFVAAGLGIAGGIIGSYWRGRAPDKTVKGFVSMSQATPEFLLALLLIFVFFFHLRWAPPPIGKQGITTTGTAGEGREPLVLGQLLSGDLAGALDTLHYLMLPVLSLGIGFSAAFAKVTRSTFADALSSRQVEFARACGLPEWRVLLYAWSTARTPILTYGAILFGGLVGGASLVETVFSWPGVGRWALTGVLALDVPVIQGFILMTGCATLLIYLCLDLLILVLDPRVRLTA